MYAIRSGCTVTFDKSYFAGRYPKSYFAGSVSMTVKVLRHSYGADKGQHTFTCEVMELHQFPDMLGTHSVGDTFRIKGRNLYPSVTVHTQGQESKEQST